MSTVSNGPTASASLTVAGVTKRFGAQLALDNVAFEAVPGMVTGLIGQNGAGKSTLLGVISGRHLPSEGEVRYGDDVLTDPRRADASTRRQVAVVHQEGSIIPELTVAENMLLTRCMQSPWRRLTRRSAATQVHSAYAALGLNAPAPGRACGLLSPADTKLLEIVRALASPARVVLLDEPTASLDPHMAQWLLRTIRRIAAEREIAVVFVSHRLREVRAVSQAVTVLRNGRVAWSGPTAALSESDMVRHIAGHPLQHTRAIPEGHMPPLAERDPVLELKDFVADGLREVNLTLRRGEVLGVAGVEGQGQHQLLYAIAGLHAHRGQVSVDGRPARTRTRRGSVSAGISFLADDRARQGLIRPMTIADNMSISALPHLSWFGVRNRRRERSFVEECRARFSIKMPAASGSMLELSGGNQQKVLFARALSVKGKVVILYEPTQGVDVSAKEEIYDLLRGLQADGAAVIVYSSDEEELCALCDRVIVMGDGRIVQEIAREDLSRDTIVGAMVAYSSTVVIDESPDTGREVPGTGTVSTATGGLA